MKKIAKFSLILIIITNITFCIVKRSHATLSGNVAIDSTLQMQKGEEFTVKFDLFNLKSDKGINALIGSLKYDESSLELIKMEGQNEWTNPVYNEEEGTFLIDRNEYLTADGTFIKATFKVKEDSKPNTYISIEEISVSNEDEEIELNSASKDIEIKESTNNVNDKSIRNIAMHNIILIVVICIFVVIGVILIIKLKSTSKEGKHVK